MVGGWDASPPPAKRPPILTGGRVKKKTSEAIIADCICNLSESQCPSQCPGGRVAAPLLDRRTRWAALAPTSPPSTQHRLVSGAAPTGGDDPVAGEGHAGDVVVVQERGAVARRVVVMMLLWPKRRPICIPLCVMSDERARIIIMPRLALYVLAVLAVIARGAESTSSSSFTYEYSSNLDLADSARRIVSTTCAKYGSIEVLGTSTEGVEVFAVRLRKENNNEGLPKVKIVGNLHGDEPTGRVLTLGLAEWLCGHVGKDERASLILSKVDLWLVPTVNPDGYALGRRGNSKDVDLNRDFPDRFDEGATSNWLP